MIKIGIECENLEDPKSRWGVGQVTLNLVKEYAQNQELQKKFKLYLYFKTRIPDDEIFNNPILIKRVAGFPSFNIFYHILMPLRAMIDRVDWMFFPAYQLPPLYLGRSMVMLTQDVYYEYKYGSLPIRYRLSYWIFTNWAARFGTKILTVSETSKKEVAKLYRIKPDKIFVDYLGVDTSSSFTALRKDNYLLYVGQMFPRRHARETILAFQKIAKSFPDLKLVLVGRDKYNPSQIKELVEIMNNRLGVKRIIYHDYIEKREDLYQLYAGAAALIYVSDREAFGLPPVEALAYGVSPVVMDNELGHELFGEYAFYSKTGNIDDIASAMRSVMTDNQKTTKIKSEGLEFIKKYSWPKFAKIFFENVEN